MYILQYTDAYIYFTTWVDGRVKGFKRVARNSTSPKRSMIWTILTWLGILATGFFIGALVARYFFLKALASSYSSLSEPKKDFQSEIEGRLEALERRMISLHGYVSKKAGLEEKPNGKVQLTAQEMEFLNGLSMEEKAMAMQKLNMS